MKMKIILIFIVLILVPGGFVTNAISSPNGRICNMNIVDNIELNNFGLDHKSWKNPNIGKIPFGWSTTEVVSTESKMDSWFPSLSVDSFGTVHIVWYERTNSGGSGFEDDIFYKCKPKGSGWSNIEVVSTESTKDSWLPSLTVDSTGTVHVTWEDWTDISGSGNDWDIFYKCKPNGGSWTTTEVVSTESTSDSSVSSLAVDSTGTVHVTWIDYTNYNGAGSDVDIFYKCKPNGGSWTTTEVVSTESNMNSWNPSLAVDSIGTVHVTWEDWADISGSGNDWDIFYKCKPSGGNWSTAELVSTESIFESWFSSLSVDSNGTLHVTWQDWTDISGSGNDWDIFYKCKPNGGSWTTTEVVTTESNKDSCHPSLAVDFNGTLHVTWEDCANISDSGNDLDIFYKCKPNGGNWSTAELVSTESTFISWLAILDVNTNKTVHVAWVDGTNIDSFENFNNDLDIFYKYKLGDSDQPPNVPSIDGQTSGKPGKEYEYIFNAVDPDEDDVRYFIDWGDNNTEWTGFNASGTDLMVKHTWSEKGDYTITAKAQDIYGVQGLEGTLTVTMPKNKAFNFNMLEWLFERFPNAFPILRLIPSFQYSKTFFSFEMKS